METRVTTSLRRQGLRIEAPPVPHPPTLFSVFGSGVLGERVVVRYGVYYCNTNS